MTDLNERFRSLGRTPAPDLWDDIGERTPSSTPAKTAGGRRSVAVLVAAVVAIGGFALAFLALREGANVIGEPSPSAPPLSALRGEVAATFPIGRDPRSVVYGAGSVWVAVSNDDGTLGGRILRIDPTTNEIVAEIPVETIPTWEVGGGAMVVAGDSLWVTGGVEAPGSFESAGGGSDAAVVRIDVTDNKVVDLFRVGGTFGADVTFLDGELWVLLFGDESVDNSMEVVRIDPTTGDVLSRIAVASGWAHSLVAADGRLLVIEGGETDVNVGGRMTSIDPETLTVAARTRIPSPYSAEGPVIWRGEVWAGVQEGFARFDSRTGQLIHRSTQLDPSTLALGRSSLESDDRAIWFLGYDGIDGAGPVRLAAYDPAADSVTELVRLNEGNPVAMAIAPDSIWILNYEGTLTRVDLIGS
jgi:hypothetical protein